MSTDLLTLITLEGRPIDESITFVSADRIPVNQCRCQACLKRAIAICLSLFVQLDGFSLCRAPRKQCVSITACLSPRRVRHTLGFCYALLSFGFLDGYLFFTEADGLEWARKHQPQFMGRLYIIPLAWAGKERESGHRLMRRD